MVRWILSKLNSLIKDVDGFYADYEPTKAGRAIQDFVSDHLSNWYVRLSRRRFWKGELTADKRAAFETLQECLLKVAQLMSPIAPFYSDWLYRNLTIGNRDSVVASVHLTDLQAANHNYIDPELEASMELAQRVSSLVHSIRKVNKIKVRQPLSRVLVPVLNEYTKQRLARVEELIKAEVNVKAVELLDDASGVLNKKVKPNFKALGPKFGPKMKEVAAGIQAMSTADIAELEKAGTLTVGGAHEITVADVEILTEDLPGFLTAQENGLTVALDVSISEELRHEGIAREFVNRIQNLRKDSGFEVADKISISVSTTEELVKAALEANREYICTEVQALSLNVLETLTDAVTVDLDEVELNVKVEVVS